MRLLVRTSSHFQRAPTRGRGRSKRFMVSTRFRFLTVCNLGATTIALLSLSTGCLHTYCATQALLKCNYHRRVLDQIKDDSLISEVLQLIRPRRTLAKNKKMATVGSLPLSAPDPSDIPDSVVNGGKRDADFAVFEANADLLNAKEVLETTVIVSVEVKEEATTAQATAPPGRYVTPKDFELMKVIGMGAFGKVLQVRNKQSKKVLAMKVISKRILRRKAGYIENVVAERDILTRVRHPFVVNMHCSFQTREKLFIIMDFLAGGELFLRLGREGIFLEKTAAFYLGEIILALDHLHTRGILHRDLKPENILLCSDGHICVTDFGLARDLSSESGFGGFQNEEDESRALTVCGTQEYMSPEMLSRKGYGRASDYWSLGCIAFEMVSGRPPFESKKGAKDLFRKIMTEKVKMPDGSTAAACKLLKGLLNRDVTKRWGTARSTMFEVGSIAGLKGADYFKHINWDKLEKKEVEPPHSAPVENDEDLRHFYDEFKEMPLPRSVHEMSMETFNPRRVASEAFRGFSFVHDDFALPDRRNSESDHYWNNLDNDGESDSEIASSKCEGEEEKPVEPEKKKRPPRKKKKKKKLESNLSPVASADNTPAPSEAGDITLAASLVGDGDKGSSALLSTIELLKTPEAPKPTVPVPTTPVYSLPPTPPPKPKEEVWAAVSSSTKKKQQQKSQAQKPKSVRTQMKSSQQQPVKQSPVGLQQQPHRPGQVRQPQKHQTSTWVSQQQQRAPDNHVARPNLAVKAQSWQPPPPSPSSDRPQWGSQPQMPLSPPSPSGDWRSHSLARNSTATPLRGIKTIDARAEAAETQPFWPTLDMQQFPPTAPTLNASKPAVKGAWASRTKK
jgi:p70 ribosomal S6 kinase